MVTGSSPNDGHGRHLLDSVALVLQLGCSAAAPGHTSYVIMCLSIQVGQVRLHYNVLQVYNLASQGWVLTVQSPNRHEW